VIAPSNDPLAELQRRLAVVRARVLAVAHRHANGFYLFGRAGTSKTYTIRTTLAKFGKPYHYHSGHLTPMGLFDLLGEQHDRTIVLDDVSELLNQKIALQILLAALGNQPTDTGSRVVKYRRQGVEQIVRFTGGIILVSNLEIHSAPLLQALKSRVHYLKYDPNDEQIEALMLDVASRGWSQGRRRMTAEDCREVADFLIPESSRLGVRPDMRLLVDKAFPDYVLHQSGFTDVHWKDLVTTTLEAQLVELRHTPVVKPNRRDTKEDEHQVIREIVAQFSDARDREVAWQKRTGKSYRAFRRRCVELGF
jgi:hypothetical protein